MASGVPHKVLLRRVEREFHEYLPEDCDHILGECTWPLRCCSVSVTYNRIGVKLCQNYDLSVEALFWKWEAVKHSSRDTHRLDASGLQELKIHVAKEQAKPTKPTKKGSSAQLSGMMSASSRALGYGPGRIPRQLGGGFISGVKREDIDLSVPVPGSSKISFSQADKVERRECECRTVANFMGTQFVHL